MTVEERFICDAASVAANAVSFHWNSSGLFQSRRLSAGQRLHSVFLSVDGPDTNAFKFA